MTDATKAREALIEFLDFASSRLGLILDYQTKDNAERYLNLFKSATEALALPQSAEEVEPVAAPASNAKEANT